MPTDRLRKWERIGLALLAVLSISFGVLVTLRSAYMHNPKTDFQVYARAGWAVRSGTDIYDVMDNNGWHFVYPPAFAIAMAPLADPYPILPRDGYLPFALSVGIWYTISLFAIGYTAHVLARAVRPGLVPQSRAWWCARLIPVLLCFGALGHTLGRGQVNTVVLALIAAGFAATMRGRTFLGGAWLATAAVVKIIPAALVLFPLARRDRRGLLGAAAAVVVFVAIVPGLVWGPTGVRDVNVKMMQVVLGPVFSDSDQTRSKELHGMTATDNQSVQAAVQAWLHPDRETRPARAVPAATLAHLGVTLGMVLATAFVGFRRLGPSPADQLIFLGCLCAVMVLATPVSHMHYYAYLLPLVAGLWYRGGRITHTVLIGWAIATCLPLFPGPIFDRLRECGLGGAATLILWVVGIQAIAQSKRTVLIRFIEKQRGTDDFARAAGANQGAGSIQSTTASTSSSVMMRYSLPSTVTSLPE